MLSLEYVKEHISEIEFDDQIDNDTFIVELDNIGKAKIQITKGE